MERVLISESSSASETNNGLVSLGAGEILLGKLESIDEAGNAIVSVPQMPLFQQRIALTTIPVSNQHVGRQLALMFTQGADPQPIIIGLIHSPLQQVLEKVIANTGHQNGDIDELVFEGPVPENSSDKITENPLYIDGQRLVLEGKDEIVLRCGEASITLNKNGKISIRGKYLLSRATGVNRILGGSVQVN
jgi:hypothetical protein